MSRGSLALCALYLATATWLAWCTIITFSSVPIWATLLNTAASIILIIAVIRETVLADERHTVAFLIQRAVRREAEAEPLPADGAPLDDSEQAVWREIAAHWDDREAA